MGVLALLVILGVVAVKSGDKTETKHPLQPNPGGDQKLPTPPQPPPQPSSDDQKSPVIPSFSDLGKVTSNSLAKTRLTKPVMIDAADPYWPGLKSLGGAWRDAALNLVSTLPYYAAMGNTPLSMPTSASSYRIYNFAKELSDANSEGRVTGNVALAITELLKAARTLERVSGIEAENRWSA